MRSVIILAIFVAGSTSVHAAMPPSQSATPGPTTARTSQEDYVIGPQDVLNITVWNDPELTGKFAVQPDGMVTMPLVGRVPATGLTTRAFEAQLTHVLADGFVRDPHVAITLDTFRGRRVFIFGSVPRPGTYPLSEGDTIIETLARAGYGSTGEVVVLRPKHASGPTLPENAGDAEVLRVSLLELEKDVEHGSLARNISLRDGDTIFVPRNDPTRIFISGQVRAPAAYSITQQTTVLQALTLAGGVTENAAINRLHIVRLVDGKQKTLKVKLSDLIQPGDTLIVPERYF